MRFLRKWLWAGSIALAFASIVTAGCGSDDGGRSSQNVFLEDRTLNIAHRGGARLWPEHTLLAYESALEAGADVIELDLHATSDGVIVALHDATVDRTTDGSGVVRSMTYAELRQLDAGYRFTRDRGESFPWRGQGLTIPTLDEALDLLGSTPMAVEIKQAVPPIAAEVLATFEAHGAVGHAIFVSFDRRPVDTIRELNPDALTAFSGQEIVLFGLLNEETLPAYEPPAPFMQPPWQLVDETFMERADGLGLKVHAWTVNDPEEMRRLIDLGVGGIFTDDPVLLEATLSESGL